MEIQDPWTACSPGERSLWHSPPCALGIRAQNGSTSEDNTSSPDQSGREQSRLREDPVCVCVCVCVAGVASEEWNGIQVEVRA